MDRETMRIKPSGILYTGLEQYFLVHPTPIEKDSWQDNNCYRFLVVPFIPEGTEQKGNTLKDVYGHTRHIVTNNFTIEYCNVPEIDVEVLDEIDFNRMTEDINNEQTNKDDFPF